MVSLKADVVFQAIEIACLTRIHIVSENYRLILEIISMNFADN